MTVDDDTMKQVTTGAGATVVAGILGFVALWFMKITGLPRRVTHLERGRVASDRLLLAIADFSLARDPKDEEEARESLRSARDEMYDSLTKSQGGKS